MPQARKRISIDVSESFKARIDSLMERTEAASLAEVIRKSVNLYDLVVSNNEKGGQIEMIYPDERIVEIKVL